MNITNEALQALVLRAYEQGYETGYIVGRGEVSDDFNDNVMWGDIYAEFVRLYPDFAMDVKDYRPYQKPYTAESKPFSIILYMKNGEKKRYSYVTKVLYPVHEEED